MSGIDITKPIVELAHAVQSGKLTARQLAETSLAKIEGASDYHTVLEINPDALKLADDVDQRIKKGETVGPLAGVPFIAKDNFLTLATHTTAGSHILESFTAPHQATAINRLEAAGAILIAKSNMDAFGHGSSTENSDFGPTKNPVDPSRVPGGSSGGSAAAVALGLCSFSVATDTGGSIRQPASLSGVVGLKPTYGLVSRSGVIAMASSTDTIGPLARSVEDAALILDVISGRDPLDATTIERDKSSYVEAKKSLKGVRVGVIKEYLGAGINAEVKDRILASAERFKAAGADVREISLPSLDLALASYYIIVPAEISSNLSRYDGVKYGYSAASAKTLSETYDQSRDQGFGAEAKRRILIGTYVLSSGYYDAYYKKAQSVRTLLIRDFAKAFEDFDVLIGPVSPVTAFPLGENTHDPLAMYLTDICTVAVSLVGVPAISIPAGYDSAGLPIGLQMIAAQRADRELLGYAQAAEVLLMEAQS